eukprot:5294645-Amphidinium_carterae.1
MHLSTSMLAPSGAYLNSNTLLSTSGSIPILHRPASSRRSAAPAAARWLGNPVHEIHCTSGCM